MKFDLARAAAILQCPLEGRDASCTGVSVDTRTLAPGELFVALTGKRYDGHEFVQRAEAAGAAGVVASRPVETRLPQLRVADTGRALGSLARWWREQFEPRVAAVTGSNGKTTVKEMLAAICRRAGATLATRGNLNNEIGVPLTLFGLRPEHRYAVVEMGANHAGEIAYLTGITRPGVGIVTNAASAHLAGFGSLDGVARAKGELFEHLPADGVAVINADDEHAGTWRALAGDRRVMDFAVEADAACRARFENDEAVIDTPAGPVRARLSLPGRHNLANAAAAAAAAVAMGIDPERIGEGLADVRPVPGRLALATAAAGHRVIDDAYNANPDSLRAGIEYLVSLPGEHWLALGAMGELGEDAAELHAHAGRQARELGVDRLFAVGEPARPAVEAFGAGGEHFADQAGLIAAVRGQVHPGVCCLVKGSRSAGMERVVEALMAMECGNDNNNASAARGT